MSVSVYQFTTSRFFLKNKKAVQYIQDLVNLINNSSNLVDNGGVYPEEYYIELVGGHNYGYILHGGDFMEVTYVLKHTAVYGFQKDVYENDEIQNEMNEGIDIFYEIQSNLKKNEYFFKETLTRDKYDYTYSILLYHENGQIIAKYSDDIKNDLTNEIV